MGLQAIPVSVRDIPLAELKTVLQALETTFNVKSIAIRYHKSRWWF